MKRRLGRVSIALTTVALGVLAASLPASAATTSGGIPLGAPFLYGEYSGGSSSLIGETVDGAAAYGGDASVTTSMVGAAPASVTAPGGVTMALGGNTDSVVSSPVLAHGHGEYVGSFTGSGGTGSFTHVNSLPISFSAGDSDLAAASSNFAALGVTNHATGTSALNLNSPFPGIDVFSLTERQLTKASNVSVHAPAGAVVVINVEGTGPLFLSAQTVTLGGGVGADNVIWNFPWVHATSFSLETWVGTILQPFGTLSMDTNTIRGSVLFGGRAARFYRDWVHLALFHCHWPVDPGAETPEVPVALMLPGSAALLCGGVVLVRRRRRSAA